MFCREGKTDDGEVLGFGAVVLDEQDEVREMFEKKFKGNEADFFEYSKYQAQAGTTHSHCSASFHFINGSSRDISFH